MLISSHLRLSTLEDNNNNNSLSKTQVLTCLTVCLKLISNRNNLRQVLLETLFNLINLKMCNSRIQTCLANSVISSKPKTINNREDQVMSGRKEAVSLTSQIWRQVISQDWKLPKLGSISAIVTTEDQTYYLIARISISFGLQHREAQAHSQPNNRII
jgi:hypothetical protein